MMGLREIVRAPRLLILLLLLMLRSVTLCAADDDEENRSEILKKISEVLEKIEAALARLIELIAPPSSTDVTTSTTPDTTFLSTEPPDENSTTISKDDVSGNVTVIDPVSTESPNITIDSNSSTAVETQVNSTAIDSSETDDKEDDEDGDLDEPKATNVTNNTDINTGDKVNTGSATNSTERDATERKKVETTTGSVTNGTRNGTDMVNEGGKAATHNTSETRSSGDAVFGTTEKTTSSTSTTSTTASSTVSNNVTTKYPESSSTKLPPKIPNDHHAEDLADPEEFQHDNLEEPEDPTVLDPDSEVEKTADATADAEENKPERLNNPNTESPATMELPKVDLKGVIEIEAEFLSKPGSNRNIDGSEKSSEMKSQSFKELGSDQEINDTKSAGEEIDKIQALYVTTEIIYANESNSESKLNSSISNSTVAKTILDSENGTSKEVFNKTKEENGEGLVKENEKTASEGETELEDLSGGEEELNKKLDHEGEDESENSDTEDDPENSDTEDDPEKSNSEDESENSDSEDEDVEVEDEKEEDKKDEDSSETEEISKDDDEEEEEEKEEEEEEEEDESDSTSEKGNKSSKNPKKNENSENESEDSTNADESESDDKSEGDDESTDKSDQSDDEKGEDESKDNNSESEDKSEETDSEEDKSEEKDNDKENSSEDKSQSEEEPTKKAKKDKESDVKSDKTSDEVKSEEESKKDKVVKEKIRNKRSIEDKFKGVCKTGVFVDGKDLCQRLNDVLSKTDEVMQQVASGNISEWQLEALQKHSQTLDEIVTEIEKDPKIFDSINRSLIAARIKDTELQVKITNTFVIGSEEIGEKVPILVIAISTAGAVIVLALFFLLCYCCIRLASIRQKMKHSMEDTIVVPRVSRKISSLDRYNHSFSHRDTMPVGGGPFSPHSGLAACRPIPRPRSTLEAFDLNGRIPYDTYSLPRDSRCLKRFNGLYDSGYVGERKSFSDYGSAPRSTGDVDLAYREPEGKGRFYKRSFTDVSDDKEDPYNLGRRGDGEQRYKGGRLRRYDP